MSSTMNNKLVDLQAFFRLRGKGVARVLLFVCAIVVITALLPHKLAFRYEYALNKPWTHKDLIAPFDFEVKKGELQMEAERNKALQQFKPFYRLDPKVAKSISSEFESQFSNELDESAFSELGSFLKRSYQKGVADKLAGALAPQAFLFLEGGKDQRLVDQRQLLTIDSFQILWKVQIADLQLSQLNNEALLRFSERFKPNVFYAEAESEKSRSDLLSGVQASTGKVQQGELIVNKGSLVYEDTYRKINSLERQMGAGNYDGAQRWWSLLGQALLVSMIIGLLVAYLHFFRPQLFDDLRRLSVVLLNLVLVVALFYLATSKAIPSVYLIPFCVLPILTRALFDGWLAMMVTLVATLLTSFYAGYASEFMVLQLAAGMAAIFTLISIKRRSQFYLSSGVIFLVYALGYTGYTLVNKGDFRELIPLYYGYFGVNAILTLIASPLLFGYERVFGFVSDVSLMELSDTNSPLLRQLSYEAPGTFQHTLQVANLAEAAIYEIGGNALLVRVGALYHDIGKLNNPIYFIENQHASVNPHDDLPFEESAQLIIGHVTDGVALAKKHRLPEIIVDFIRTHHGDQRVEYFYQSQLRQNPDEFIDEGRYRYPGPKPFSKETAVLMMADSVEAASRSLKNPTAQSIADLVEGIINKQLANDQFINADITLRDIARIKKLFRKMLGSIYHVRIEYPGQQLR